MQESESEVRTCASCLNPVRRAAKICPMCQNPMDNPSLDLTLSTFRGVVFNFLVALSVGMIANIVSYYFIDSSQPDKKIFNISRFAQLHWAVWICCVSVFYSVVCYVKDRRMMGKAKRPFTVPTWSQLQSYGDKRAARISYWALGIIPFMAYFISSNPFQLEIFTEFEVPLTLKLAFFASWFFSISLFLFAVGRPEKLVTEQQNTTHNDVNGKLADESNLELRAVVYGFYTLGVSIAVIIFCRSAWVVVHA